MPMPHRTQMQLIKRRLIGKEGSERVWGPSARFAGQQIGQDHLLADGDTVEIIA